MGMKFALIFCHMFGLLLIVNNVHGKIDIKNLPCFASRSCYSRPTRKDTFDDFKEISDNVQSNEPQETKTLFRMKGDDKPLANLPKRWKQAIRDVVALAMSDSRQQVFTSATNLDALKSSSNWNDVQQTNTEYYLDNKQDIETNKIQDNRLNLWKLLMKNRK
ncbi:uncharacterized protein LOC117103480 [Anneissia japonica]|uniref:uncharacterized protein LOC117103480 n=1 Tax=Anneissia japonica TaxID=1529436 RepID=UPI0014259842|nr:uncharacterized protein LOC117103480 [Anneissia japonica]